MRAMRKLYLPQLQVPGMEGHPELAACGTTQRQVVESRLQSLSCGMCIQPCFQMMHAVQN